MSVASLLVLVLGGATFGILAGPLIMGLYRMAFKTMRQERPEMGDLFNWEGRFLQAFLTFLVFGLIHLGASALFNNSPLSFLVTLVVSPFLTLLFGLTMPSILERRADAAQAINDVSRMVFSRDALMWWVVGLVLMAISGAGLMGCFVGIFVTVPWMISSAAVAYRDKFGVEDPNRTNQ
jgi:uncharacterized membrane protein